jgi:hypothetical protein
MRRNSDQFLSEEDLDLQNLSFAELLKYWELWLRQAQISNSDDEHSYSHGVFSQEPPLSTRLSR